MTPARNPTRYAHSGPVVALSHRSSYRNAATSTQTHHTL